MGSSDGRWSLRAVRSLRIAGWRAVVATVGAAGVAVTGLAPGAAGASAAAKPHDVTIKIDGIGLGGQPVAIPFNQTALWAVTRADLNSGPIYADPDGHYRVLPGTYLAGGYVPVSNGHYQNTVVIRTVTIKASETITLDSRAAKPFSVALTGASAQPQGQFADVCVRGGSGASSWATGFLPSYVTPGGSQYVQPVTDKRLVFVYHGLFTSTSGQSYYVAGVHAGGLPAHPVYSARPADLARLTVAARSGTVAGSAWASGLSWQHGSSNCGADLTPGVPTLALPGQVTQYVSPGQLSVSEFGVGRGESFSFGQDVRVAAGRSYTVTFDNAVAGPATGTPVVGMGVLCADANAMYGDPVATSWQTDAAGTVTLRRGGRLVGRRGFGPASTCFRVGHKSGWYTMTESGHHAAPPAGITPATLSTSISVAWHFRIPALSVVRYLNNVQLPATLTTFDPAGLGQTNQAPPGRSTRIVLHVIRNGGYLANMALTYRLRSVQVQYSADNGHTWRSEHVTARHGYWVVSVPGGFGGFISLRSIVTDVRGNSTVETIDRAYARG